MTYFVSLAVFKLVLGQHDAWGSLYEGRAGRPETQAPGFIPFSNPSRFHEKWQVYLDWLCFAEAKLRQGCPMPDAQETLMLSTHFWWIFVWILPYCSYRFFDFLIIFPFLAIFALCQVIRTGELAWGTKFSRRNLNGWWFSGNGRKNLAE